jgi:hypothetical protein
MENSQLFPNKNIYSEVFYCANLPQCAVKYRTSNSYNFNYLMLKLIYPKLMLKLIYPK